LTVKSTAVTECFYGRTDGDLRWFSPWTVRTEDGGLGRPPGRFATSHPAASVVRRWTRLINGGREPVGIQYVLCGAPWPRTARIYEDKLRIHLAFNSWMAEGQWYVQALRTRLGRERKDKLVSGFGVKCRKLVHRQGFTDGRRRERHKESDLVLANRTMVHGTGSFQMALNTAMSLRICTPIWVGRTICALFHQCDNEPVLLRPWQPRTPKIETNLAVEK
jgi:hypothetical protein